MHIFHKWIPVAIHQAKYVHGDETTILFRCERCPAVKAETINGHWTLEQLLAGKPVGGK